MNGKREYPNKMELTGWNISKSSRLYHQAHPKIPIQCGTYLAHKVYIGGEGWPVLNKQREQGEEQNIEERMNECDYISRCWIEIEISNNSTGQLITWLLRSDLNLLINRLSLVFLLHHWGLTTSLSDNKVTCTLFLSLLAGSLIYIKGTTVRTINFINHFTRIIKFIRSLKVNKERILFCKEETLKTTPSLQMFGAISQTWQSYHYVSQYMVIIHKELYSG